MVNGLGVLGWGVGGIEAEAAMLGEPLSMLVPQVVGFELARRAARRRDRHRPRADRDRDPARGRASSASSSSTSAAGSPALTVADRATLGNMSPEYGATCGFFPVDEATLDYLRLTGRSDERDRARRGVLQGEPALARARRAARVLAGRRARPRRRSSRRSPGPRRPQDRVPLARAKAVVPRGARHVRRRATNGSTTPRSRRRSRRATRRPSRRPAGDRSPRPTPPSRRAARRRAARVRVSLDGEDVRARPRRGRDRRDHLAARTRRTRR